MKKKKQPVNTWKQSKSPPIHKWTKKMHFTYTHTLTFIHIYNGVLFSQKKRNLAISDNKDGVWGHSFKWNKSNRERQKLDDLTYMWNLKKKESHKYRDQVDGCYQWQGLWYGWNARRGSKCTKIGVVGRIMIPSNHSYPDPYDSWMLPYIAKGILPMLLKLRNLRWRDYRRLST